jgi:cyclomaltodextrinase / maltogenic alpha-amylase / neopullulanase
MIWYVRMSANWVKHAIWWQVYPLGFVGADITGTDITGTDNSDTDASDVDLKPDHRLPHLEDWLDYAVRLGASGLALGPIFASSTHGYDTTDYRRIDPRLGDDEDFDHLVAAAHSRGLRVLLDGVFNHVGREFPAFRRVLDQGPAAPEADWFHLTWPEDAGAGPGPGTEPHYANFEGHPGLVTLNHANPAVADYVTAVMNHWLDRGADGWRLDAAYAVPRTFWADVLPRVRRAHPEAYLVGEVIHGDYGAIVQETGLDSVTQYELWKAIWSALNDRNLFELAWALKRHNAYLDTFVPLTFVGNHDVTRLASKLTDVRHLSHALVVLLTVGGTPSIYYGDEQAFQGVKEDRAGGDDAVRPEYPADPAALASYGWPTYRLHQDLIGLRRRYPWLYRARTGVIELTNEHLVYEVVDGEDRLVVALNLADSDFVCPRGSRILLASLPDLTSRDTGYPAPDPNSVPVLVPAHGWIIAESAAD